MREQCADMLISSSLTTDSLHLSIHLLEWHWIGLVVSISAFGSEGRRFESTKGYTPDRDMCASLLVRVAPHCKPSPG